MTESDAGSPHPVSRRTIRVFVALIPLGLTPGLFWLIAEAYLNLGGGEKDIVLIIPWMLWSVVYGAAFVFESRRVTVAKAVLRGVCWATGLLLALFAALYLLSQGWLGVKGL